MPENLDLDRIKKNVRKMVDMGAPESDIDAYISEEGTTIDQIKSHKIGDMGFSASQKEVLSGAADVPAQLSQRTIVDDIKSALPGAMQFLGGFGGAALGSQVNQPAAGSAVGGTLGRVAGRVGSLGIGQVQEDPAGFAKDAVKKSILSGPFMGTVGTVFDRMTPQQRQAVGKEALSTGATEAIFAPIGAGASKVFNAIFKNIGGALLGDRVMDRASERGFGKILDKKHFQGRLAKDVATKSDKFFKKLTDVTGNGVKRAINAPGVKDQTVDTMRLKQGLAALNQQFGQIDDFGIEVSTAQKKMLKHLTGEVENLSGDIKIPDLWEMRKRFDRVMFGKTFAQEADEYLEGLRKVLSQPLRESSDEVAKAFNKYSFVKTQEKDLAKNFVGSKFGDEIFSPKTETFASNVLKTNKDEQIRLLRQLDSFLSEDDRVIEQLLDAAAAEQIDRPIQLLGLPSRIVSGAMGGRRSVANFGKFLQGPVVQGTRSGLGRAAVVGASELTAPRDQ